MKRFWFQKLFLEHMMASQPTKDLSDAHTTQTSLEGRRVIVTGGSTGIGRAIAVLLASEGARVFICGRDEQHLADGLQRINAVGQGDGVAVDLAKPEGLRRFFSAADAWLAGLDVAVINAAVGAETVLDGNEEELRHILETNFVSYLISAREAARRMPHGGHIVLIGSMSAETLGEGASTYVATKAGIQGFAKSFRKEMAERNIKVCLIEPGRTGSDMQYENYSSQEQADAINADEMLRAEDIAVATQFVLTQPGRTVISQMLVEPLITK